MYKITERSAEKLFLFLNVNFEQTEQLEILQLTHQFDLTANYKNKETASRIFLSFPVAAAFAERSFNKLELIKNYLGATMARDRLPKHNGWFCPLKRGK